LVGSTYNPPLPKEPTDQLLALGQTQFNATIPVINYWVATGQGWSEEKGQGKVREFYFESGKIDILKKSQGKLNYNFIYHWWLKEIFQVAVISPSSLVSFFC